MKLYQKIAQHIQHGKQLADNPGKYPAGEDLFQAAKDDIRHALPSGSGFDSGITLNYEESKPDRIVLNADFHHMTEHGYYDGWTEHKIIITPSLAFGFCVSVSGTNRNDIKEYISDFACNFLDEEF